jgi:hypothetical protein
VGLGLRLFHYVRNPAVWHDEAALLVNVLEKSYRDLLGPLLFGEAAPPLFLWLERALSQLAGDGTAILRVVPFLASCGALLLLLWAARRCLHPEAVPWAVLLLACSNRLLWHSCEAKPYAVDVFAATVVLALFFMPAALDRKLLVAVALAPLLILLSYPGVFLCGGLLVALLPGVHQRHRFRTWLLYSFLTLVIVGTFLWLVYGPARAQRCNAMDQCWVGQFPPWRRPWMIPTWTLFSSLDVFRYCFEPTGHVLALAAGAGAVQLWRSRQRTTLALLLVPAALALLASFVDAYPWGGARVEIFLAPALALLIAAGVWPVLEWARARGRWAVTVLVLIVAAPLGWAGIRVTFPWPRSNCTAAVEYVLSHRQETDPVIANHWENLYYFRPLGSAFTPLSRWEPHGESRLWVVLMSGVKGDRLATVPSLAGGRWQTLDHQEFQGISVYLLSGVRGQAVPRQLSSSIRGPAAGAASDQRRHVAALETAVDIDHHDIGRAAVQHR